MTQTNSVKALKEVVVLRIGFSPTRSTSPCYNTTCPTTFCHELCKTAEPVEIPFGLWT